MAFHRRLRKAFFVLSASKTDGNRFSTAFFRGFKRPWSRETDLKSGVFAPTFHGRKSQIARFQRFSDLRRRLRAVDCLCSPHRPTLLLELPTFNLAEYVKQFLLQRKQHAYCRSRGNCQKFGNYISVV